MNKATVISWMSNYLIKTIQRNVCTRWKSRRSGSSMQKYDQIIDAHPIDIQILESGKMDISVSMNLVLHLTERLQ